MAEKGGFEPPNPKNGLPHFECGAFDHSATFPKIKIFAIYKE